MKKVLFVILSVIIIVGCSKNEDLSKHNVQDSIQPSTTEEDTDYSIASGDYFIPDYRPLKPEEQLPSGKVVNVTGNSNYKTDKIQNSIIKPEIRELKEYALDYSTEKSVFNTTQASGEIPTTDNNEPFTVSDWGPKGTLPAEIRKPSFYVLFSKPIVALQSLTEPSNTSEYMQIEPKIKGTFRWYGTSLLSFEATENVNPLQVYTISIPNSVKALDGSSITGNRMFKTEAASLKIVKIKPGKPDTIIYYSVNEYDYPPEEAKEVDVQFNYPVNASNVEKLVTISSQKRKFSFTTKQVSENIVHFNLIETPNTESTIIVSVGEGANLSQASYKTLKKFDFIRYYSGSSYGKYTNPVYIYFTHPIDEKSLEDCITTDPEMKVTKDNYEVSGNCLTVFGLPVVFNAKYKLTVKDKIKDAHGRKLPYSTTVTVQVANADSYASYTDQGIRMLEAQFPHKLVFEYQNVLSGSTFEIRKNDNPLLPWNQKWDPSSITAFKMKTEPKNKKIIQEVDLDPFLTNGYGSVLFNARALIPNTRNPNKLYENNCMLSIQVTDLAATMRYGVNKAIVLITNLSTGNAVPDADVYLFNKETTQLSDIFANPDNYLHTKSDENGIAIIESPDLNPNNFLGNKDYAFYIAKGDDSIICRMDTHSSWASGVYSRSLTDAYTTEQKVFMFSDRGLYKPGETLTFKGIDRSLLLSQYTAYNGPCEITLREQKWREPKTYNTIATTTTQSGSFDGSFVIPEDIEPGRYYLTYKRVEENISSDKQESHNIEINVAYFERVKSQASISAPNIPIITGDEINATLSASYLSGGSLSGAAYETYWFREPWYFTSNEPEFKNYRFGLSDASGNSQLVSESKGNLSGDGTTNLQCKTSGSDLKATPYCYRISSNVTDSSNQMLSASKNIVVHPASYYIALSSKPKGVSGFPKAQQKLTFDYKLANIQGSLLTSLDSVNKKAKIELIREEWKAVQQRGVNNSVYTRYEKEEIIEHSQEVSLNTTGNFNVTPEKAGFYSVKISSTDSKGRDVITDCSFFATGSGANSWYNDNDESLRLTPSQNMYNPGDTAQVLLESPLPKGKYLITVEREGIFTEEVKDFDSSVQVLDIPIARNYVPVVYVSVSSYSVRKGPPTHEYGTSDLDKPKQYYGVTSLFVNPRVKAFSVKVECDKTSYKPGEEVSVTLTATKGGIPIENAELTFMAVDRGILDIINYHVPDPIAFFYNTDLFPLSTRGGDSRELLMDPVTYEIKNLQGGDSGENKLDSRTDFNPTAVFKPTLVTDKQGKVSFTFTLPDSLTTYRITAFGVQNELLALQEDEIIVQNPINVQTVMSEYLRERDTTQAGVLITNLTPDEQKINVSVKLTDNAFVDGKDNHSLTVHGNSNAVVYFDIAAKQQGNATVTFTITSDLVNETLEHKFVIQKPVVYETVTTTGVIDDKETKATEGIAIPSFANDDNGSLFVSLDASQLSVLKNAVNYVFDYPYGCLEQQSSKILPLVIFENYIDAFELKTEIDNPQKTVKSFFKEWAKVQQADGGFPYWSDGTVSSPFVSMRIGHIYALARERGYTADDLGINAGKLVNYLKTKFFNTAANQSAYGKAYSFYIFELLGQGVNTSALNELYATDPVDICALAFTGLTYLKKNTEESKIMAKKCADKIKTFMRPTTRGVDITNPNDSKFNFIIYGSKTEQLALTLQLFASLDAKDAMCSRLLFTLLENEKNGYWQNTAITARVLESVYTVIKNQNLDNIDLTANASIDGNEILKANFKGVSATSESKKLSFTDKEISSLKKDTILPLLFSKKGDGSLYYTASLQYALPQENITAREEGVGLSVTITDVNAETEVKDTKLALGKIYKATVKVYSTHDRTYLAMRAPIPSGAEILNASFANAPVVVDPAAEADPTIDWHYVSHQAIYANEIQYFWDKFPKGETTITFMFRTSKSGIYPTPPVQAECMYEPEVFGRTEGHLYTIE